MVEKNPSYASELARRYRVTAATVNVLFALIILLIAVGYFGASFLYRPGSGWAIGALRLSMLVLALGAIMYRRTKFQAMRLQDIAALRGVSALLATLQSTTVQVAFIGLAIALVGFINTILSGSALEILRAGLIAIILLIYCYPRRSAWEKVVDGIEKFGDANAEA
jgi:hypothetical protein